MPLALFALVFAYLSRRRGWLLTLAAAWVTVLLADLVLARFSVPAGIALALAVLALHGAGLVLRRFEAPAPERVPAPWWDLPARAVATGALVLLITGLAASLGPTVTGVLAPFPIALSVVCAFVVAQQGHGAVIALLKGIVPGLDGFALFCFLVAVTIEPLGVAAALLPGHRRRSALRRRPRRAKAPPDLIAGRVGVRQRLTRRCVHPVVTPMTPDNGENVASAG